MNSLLSRRKTVVFLLAAVFSLALLPGSAYAANIDNSISVSKTSVPVGKAVTITTRTTYEWLGAGGAGIPFISAWWNQIPYTYYSKPTMSSYTGSTGGAWKIATSIRTSGRVWQQKTQPSWFAGKTIWRGTYTTKANAKTSYKKFAHGQTTNLNSSEGPTAYVKVKNI